ncbi:MAG: helix-turn-helix domain-containing protein [Anaerolineae bacterium]
MKHDTKPIGTAGDFAQPPFLYEIRVKGRLSGDQWTAWFDDLAVSSRRGESTLTGRVPDHAALYGLLAAPVAPQHAPPRTALLEPLSERELEVQGLIAAGCSNAEIGRKLYIAVGTVKRHVNNIYGKLQVQSRTQAVARARELDLIS